MGSTVTVTCVVCGKEAMITGESDGSYVDLNLTEASMTKVHGSIVCTSEAKAYKYAFTIKSLRAEIDSLKTRINNLESK